MLDLVDLQAFARIAELKSVSAAARVLKAPKSSVSRSLARLEAAVQMVLVERSTRHLRLTDAGMLLLPYALRVLNDVDEAETALGSFADVPRGTLRVNAPTSFAVGLLAPMLPGFLARFPELRVVLDLDNRWIDIRAEEVDVAIRVGTPTDTTLIARRLATVELWACAGQAYLASHGSPASAADLSDHILIAWVDQTTHWSFGTADGRTDKVEVRPGTVVPEPAAMQVLLTGGAGIGRLPDFMAASAIFKGELVRVLPDLRPDAFDVYAVYPSHRSLSAKVRVFIDALAVHLKATR